jgi:formiminotetrahydrofolate cyclodeaminase
MNVRVNVKALADENFTSQLAQECVVLEKQAEAEKAELDRFISSVLEG